MRRPIIAAAMLAATLAAPARADDSAANAVYERMQASSMAADPAPLLETVYGQEATYLPGHKDVGIERREAILGMMVGSQQHLRKSGGRLDVKFRVVDRKRFGDVYVDNGYMRTAVSPDEDAPEQVSYSKFVTVIARQPEGHWAFVTDGDSDTPAANFENAKPVEGLKFDR